MNGKRNERIKLNDTEAALRMRDKESGAWFRDVYQDIERVTRAVCWRRGFANDADIEDLIAETAMDLTKAIPSFRGECSPTTLTRRIAEANCNDWLRKKYRRPGTESIDGDDEDGESRPPTDMEDASQLSAENHLCAKRAAEELMTEHPEWYEAWCDHVFAGLSAEEMCAKFERAAGAMRMQLSRVRAALKALCKKHCGTESCLLA